jgi:segregation and condensation protein B
VSDNEQQPEAKSPETSETPETIQAPEAFGVEVGEVSEEALEEIAEVVEEMVEAVEALQLGEETSGLPMENESQLLRSGVLERIAAQVTPARGAPELELCAQLFSAHKPMSELELAEAMGLSCEQVAGTLARLEDTLTDSPFGVFRRRTTLPGKTKAVTGYVLDLKADFRRNVVTVGRPVLGAGLTETLALIALNQPIMQSRLVRERGSSVYDHVKELVARDWVVKVKRGRSSELRTTESFAAEFGLQNDPELIKRALARAAGVQGAPQIVASQRVAFEHEQAVNLYTEAQQFVPTPEEMARREQERQAREAQAAAARALLEAEALGIAPQPGQAPATPAPGAAPLPTSLTFAANTAPATPAPTMDPFARLAAALEASEKNPRENCVVSGGGVPQIGTPSGTADDESEPTSELGLGEGLVSGGLPPQPNRLAEVLQEEAEMRAEREKEEPETTPEQEESQSRVGHLLNLLGDDSTEDDW